MRKIILLAFIFSIIPVFLRAQGCDNYKILIQIYFGANQQEIDDLLKNNNLVQSGELLVNQFIVAHRIGVEHKLYADSVEIHQLDSIITNLEKAKHLVKSASKNNYYKHSFFGRPGRKSYPNKPDTSFISPIDSIKNRD